jgi:flagellar capping protein FliD
MTYTNSLTPWHTQQLRRILVALITIAACLSLPAQAQSGNTPPAELKSLLTQFKKADAIAKWPSITPMAKARAMGYFKLARSKPELGDRTVASGVSGVILGYAEVSEVAAFVEEFRRTGKAAKSVPLPYANFKGAADKFPEATTYLKQELETSKQLDDQVNAVLKRVAEKYKRETADLQKQIDDLDRQIEQLDRILKSLDRILVLTK